MAQNTRKLVGVILMLAMLVAAIAALTVTASAADTEIVFNLGADGSASHSDNNTKQTSYTEKVGNYTLSITGGTNMYPGSRDAKGNGCIKLGTSSATGSFSFTVPSDVTSVIIAVGKYKNDATKVSVNDTAYTISTSSNDGSYTNIVVDTTSTKTIEFKGTSKRTMVNSITYVVAGNSSEPDCTHANAEDVKAVAATCTTGGYTAGVYCPDCETYVSGHEEVKAFGHSGGTATCEDLAVCDTCGEEYGKLAAHDYVNGACSTCGETQPLESTITFDDASKRVSSTTSQQVWKENGITVTYDKNSYNNNLAEYAKPIRFYAGTKVTISYPNMVQIVIVANSDSYATTLASSISGSVQNGKEVTITLNNVGDSYSFVPSAQVRVDSITVLAAPAGNPECTHANTVTETIDPTCTEAGKVIIKCADENCGAIVETTEGAAALGHLDTNGDYQCDREDCGKVATPAADSALTIEQALAIGALTTTTDKYYLTGTITGFYGENGLTYGNVYITDGTNTILIYGLYSIDGSVRYDAMKTKPVVGDEITVYGILTSYNGVGQMKSGWLDELVQHTHSYQYDCSTTCSICGGVREAEHVYFYPCDAHCMICGELTNEDAAHNVTHVDAVEATCQSMGNVEYWVCNDCGSAWTDEALTQQTNRMSIVTFKDHEYFYPCDAHCMLCGELTNEDAAHTLTHVDAVEATCNQNGNVEYWTCTECGYAWLDEACTMVANRFTVIVPALAAVAQIGDVKYATLQDAFNAAVDGDTIVLLDDVAVDKYVDVAYQQQEGDTYDDIVARVLTLDLNGKTISTGEGYKFSNFGVVYVGLKQTLTITNGTITCNVKEEVTVGGYGVINLENCTLINEAGAPAFCIYQSKPGDQYNGDAYGEGIYTGTGSIGAGVVFDGEIEIQGILVANGKEVSVAFKGAGVRYAKGNGTLEDPAKVSIRFGYEFSDISLVKAWGWSYSANGKTLTAKGQYAADNVTNLVLTNIPTAFLGAEITVELWYTVEINGVDVTIYDGGNARVTAEVLANTVTYDSDANAVAYAKAALYLAGKEDYKAEYDAWISKNN